MSIAAFTETWTRTIGVHFASLKKRALNFPWLIAIAAIGMALRWAGLVSGALWFDEAFSVAMSRLGLFEMMQTLRSNISPPLWEMVVWFTTRLFGWNEFAYRIIPFIASVLALFVFWRLTQQLEFTRMQQVFGCALAALLPYQLWVAQEARIYSILGLLYLLGILWAIQARYLGLAAVMGLILWSHNTGLFLVASLVFLALLAHPRRYRDALLAGVVAVLSWLPWLPVAFRESRQLIPFLPPLTLETLTFSFIFDSFASTTFWLHGPILPTVVFYASFILALTIQAAWLLKWMARRPWLHRINLTWHHGLEYWENQSKNNFAWVATSAFWMPLTLFALSNLFIQNTLFYRTMSPLIPPLILWLTVALIPVQPKLINALLPCVWIGMVVCGLLIWSPQDRGTNLKPVVDTINHEWQSGDVIYYANDVIAVLFAYYLPGKDQYIIDADDMAGGKGIIEAAQLNVQRAALENIPHTRAWLVAPDYDYIGPREEGIADRRMRAYVAPCVLIANLPYWQYAHTSVHLCFDSVPTDHSVKTILENK